MKPTFFTAPIDENGYIDLREPKQPVRASILSEALNLTCGDRQQDYGDPRPNQALAGKIKRLLREYAARDISDEEWESLDMSVSKLSRIVTGPKPKRDNYTDMAAYASMAGEMALGSAEQPATVSEEAPSASALAAPIVPPSQRPFALPDGRALG